MASEFREWALIFMVTAFFESRGEGSPLSQEEVRSVAYPWVAIRRKASRFRFKARLLSSRTNLRTVNWNAEWDKSFRQEARAHFWKHGHNGLLRI